MSPLRNPLRTLRGRLATTYAGLALLAVAVSALYTTNTLQQVAVDRIATDLGDEARIMSDALAGPLADGDLPGLEAATARLDALALARIVVVDRAGTVLATSQFPPPTVLPGDQESLQHALQGETVVATGVAREAGKELVQVTLPIADRDGRVVGALRASYNLEDIQDTIARLNATTILGAVGAAILAAVLGLMLATSFARPVQRVADAANELADTRTSTPLPDPYGPDEVRVLVHAFNSLARQLAVHEQARLEFASDVSHELHSLASAMQTAATALERGAAEENPGLSRRLVSGLVGHTQRLTRLADDLLEMARWEGGRLRLEVAEFDLTDLVEGVRDEWLAEARRRGLSLEVDVPSSLTPVRGDPVRLAQALGNLVENALKYSGQAGQVRIEARAGPRDGQYGIDVSDSGPGIPAEILPRVFDRYYRVEGRASGGPGGMGLGLAIARSIARAHGGDLTAESPPSGGARFALRLPVAGPVPTSASVPLETPSVKAGKGDASPGTRPHSGQPVV